MAVKPLSNAEVTMSAREFMVGFAASKMKAKLAKMQKTAAKNRTNELGERDFQKYSSILRWLLT